MYEIGGIIALGIMAQWLAWKMGIPAILPLILTGLCVGPVAELITGHPLIRPVYDPELERGLFPGKTLYHFVSLAIGIILFEGGLTLRRKELIGLGRSILTLVTLGAMITFITAGIAAYFIMDMSWEMAIVFSSLIIVTGPTVITPILRNLNLKRKVSTVLKWEGIIIDPIGALVAVLAFNFVLAGASADIFSEVVLVEFLRILAVGFGVGVAAAYFLQFIIKKEWVPHYLLNVVALALVLSVFMLSHLIAHESGLLTVVVMGILLANLEVPKLEEILNFKESITLLLISILFILLSANIRPEQLEMIGWSTAILIAVIILVVRPLSVFLSTYASDMTWQEKAFISWVGPRGIVAAGVASLFGIKLEEVGIPGAEMIMPLVFMIVLATVLINATTAGLVARLLGVSIVDSSGILIIGANEGARMLAGFLQKEGRSVTLLDNSYANVEEAKKMGLVAFQEDIFNEDLLDNLDLKESAFLLAMSGSDEVNHFAVNRLGDYYGEKGFYRLVTRKEIQNKRYADEVLFSPIVSSLYLNRISRHWDFQEISLENKEDIKLVLDSMPISRGIPLFIRLNNGRLAVVTAGREEIEEIENGTLIYLSEKENPNLLEELKRGLEENALTGGEAV